MISCVVRMKEQKKQSNSQLYNTASTFSTMLNIASKIDLTTD